MRNQAEQKQPRRPAKEWLREMFSTKSFKAGGYSTLVTVGVIVICIIAVLLVNQLPSTYTKFDLTQNRLFSLSEQTKSLLSNLDEDITIYVIVQKGMEDTTLIELLERYRSLNNKISISYVDPVERPAFAKQYTSETLFNNSLVVTSEKRSIYISNLDIYTEDYSNYETTGTYELVFEGENWVTGAIDYVTSDNLPVLYILSGHGETTLPTSLNSSIAAQNINAQPLSLLTQESVPEDASCVLIVSPKSDISAEELQKLRVYLREGGNVLLFTDYSNLEMPNIAALASDFGLEKYSGLVVEGQQDMYMGYTYYLLPQIRTHTITRPIISGKYRVLLPVAEGIIQTGSVPESVTVSQLLTTSESAYVKHDTQNATTLEREEGDIEGPFALAVVAENKITDDLSSRLVWFSTSRLLETETNASVAGANYDLFLNTLNWMCEREDKININPKSLLTSQLTITSGSSMRWAVALVLVVPLAFIVSGIMVIVRRKRK